MQVARIKRWLGGLAIAAFFVGPFAYGAAVGNWKLALSWIGFEVTTQGNVDSQRCDAAISRSLRRYPLTDYEKRAMQEETTLPLDEYRTERLAKLRADKDFGACERLNEAASESTG